MEMVIQAERQVDHFFDLGNDFGAAAKARQEVADVAVVLLDRIGQVLAGEELVFRDEAVEALPIVADEGPAFEPDFVDELAACGVITATKNPGNGSPSERVIGSPNPEFTRLFFRKCHISSSVTTTWPGPAEGSGMSRAAALTQFRTDTSLTPRSRAMEQKLMLPIA